MAGPRGWGHRIFTWHRFRGGRSVLSLLPRIPQFWRWAVRAVIGMETTANGSRIWKTWKSRFAKTLGKCSLFLSRHPEWGSGGRGFKSRRPDSEEPLTAV